MPKVTYVEANGRRHTVEVDENQSLMEGAVFNDVPGIVGQCGGICSCATCHCYIGAEWSAKLKKPMEQGELATLELAWDRRAESRLGCQVAVTSELDGIVVHLPAHQSTGEV
jgi:2Fe-2S ferredoxin